MANIFADITKTIGKTPLVRLNRMTEGIERGDSCKNRILQSSFQCEGQNRRCHD